MESPILTLAKMAELLDISPKRFRQDVVELGIPFYRTGKRKRFDPDEVRAHLRMIEVKREAAAANVVTLPSRVKRSASRFADLVGV